jgi:hypothetical protein
MPALACLGSKCLQELRNKKQVSSRLGHLAFVLALQFSFNGGCLQVQFPRSL